MVWSVDWWTVLGWTGFALGLVVAGWALLWDRARGRLRCPKCWYDLAAPGSGKGNEGATAGGFLSKCPECGRVVKREGELRRTRRRWRWGVPALVVMVLGLVAGSVHDPAGVRSRGWVALVPTPLLVMIAPVGEVMQEEGAGDERRLVWERDPTSPVLHEFYWRMFRGEIAGWEGRWFFARVERRFPDLGDALLSIKLPSNPGGDVWVWGSPQIVLDVPGHFVSPQYPLTASIHLPSRVRLVGRTASAWHVEGGYVGVRRGALICEDLRAGRYVVECEFYLPAQSQGGISGVAAVPVAWSRIFRPGRRVWAVTRELVITPSGVPSMEGLDSPEITEAIVSNLMPPEIGVDSDGNAWLFLMPPAESLTWADLSIGVEMELWRGDVLVGVSRALVPNPPPNRNVHWMGGESYPIRRIREIEAGELLTLRLIGDAVRSGADPWRRAYWSGELTMEIGPLESIDASDSRIVGTRVTVDPMEE